MSDTTFPSEDPMHDESRTAEPQPAAKKAVASPSDEGWGGGPYWMPVPTSNRMTAIEARLAAIEARLARFDEPPSLERNGQCGAPSIDFIPTGTRYDVTERFEAIEAAVPVVKEK